MFGRTTSASSQKAVEQDEGPGQRRAVAAQQVPSWRYTRVSSGRITALRRIEAHEHACRPARAVVDEPSLRSFRGEMLPGIGRCADTVMKLPSNATSPTVTGTAFSPPTVGRTAMHVLRPDVELDRRSLFALGARRARNVPCGVSKLREAVGRSGRPRPSKMFISPTKLATKPLTGLL